VITDEHTAYKSLKERECDHHTVNHGEGEYASGRLNEIHTNTYVNPVWSAEFF